MFTVIPYVCMYFFFVFLRFLVPRVRFWCFFDDVCMCMCGWTRLRYSKPCFRFELPFDKYVKGPDHESSHRKNLKAYFLKLRSTRVFGRARTFNYDRVGFWLTHYCVLPISAIVCILHFSPKILGRCTLYTSKYDTCLISYNKIRIRIEVIVNFYFFFFRVLYKICKY